MLLSYQGGGGAEIIRSESPPDYEYHNHKAGQLGPHRVVHLRMATPPRPLLFVSKKLNSTDRGGLSARSCSTIHREEHGLPPLFPWMVHPDAGSSRGCSSGGDTGKLTLASGYLLNYHSAEINPKFTLRILGFSFFRRGNRGGCSPRG